MGNTALREKLKRSLSPFYQKFWILTCIFKLIGLPILHGGKKKKKNLTKTHLKSIMQTFLEILILTNQNISSF